MHPLDQGVVEIAAQVRTGVCSAEELTRSALTRIAAKNAELGAFLTVSEASAIETARAVDAKRARGEALGPLAGVPMAIKDALATCDAPTTAGSRILLRRVRPEGPDPRDGYVSPYDATVVERLRRADAILVGKANMDELAMGSSNETSAFFPARNPHDSARTPGGSSGGSAVAVAAGMTPGALGSDTGGSVRQPAALTGIVGIKPTWGRVSRYGLFAFASSLDQVGVFARDVRGAARLLEVIAGHDPRDATSARDAVPDLGLDDAPSDARWRIGVPEALLREGVEPGGLDRVRRALDAMTRRGATVVPVELGVARHAIAAYYVLATAEASSNLARYDGVRYGLREPRPALLDMYMATRETGFGAEVKRRIMLGTFVLRADSYEEYYGRAQRVRTLIARDYDAAFARCDVIASPTSPVPAFRLGERTTDPLAMYLSDVFTIGANLAGLPAMSIPAGFTAGATPLPIGLHLSAPRLAEPTLLAVAAAHEAATEWHLRVPPGWPSASGPLAAEVQP